ncbi:hypothetical protein AX16_007954 [Volvariella volvacea WC 439]|nr:hypothetical protein AX16_007954 [Volvariella volvacea WC 439]
MRLPFTLLWLIQTTIAINIVTGTTNSTSTAARSLGKCGSVITPEVMERAEQNLRVLKPGAVEAIAPPPTPTDWPPVEIEVYWHVVVANETYRGGWITPEQIAVQMNVLNEDFAQSGISFRGRLVTRIINEVWFNEIRGFPETQQHIQLQDSLKYKYRVGGPETLNIYTVGFSNDNTDDGRVLGYSTFPVSYADTPWDDGVVLLYTAIPGVSSRFLGRVLTHEVGHWVGLYHTFEGGCFAPGDYVDDTPPQRLQTTGCPTGRDTCLGGGPDPIHNFMDYSDEDCMREFTPGQIQRMRMQLASYRGIGIPESG